MKTRKRALIDSWLSAAFCLMLIVGVSWAWFTTNNHVEADMIQVGEMQVEFVDAKGTSLESKTLQWMTQNINHWEPGCVYYTEPFTVNNTGDLYFKYKLSIDGFTGDTELLDVLEFHIYKYDTKTNKVDTKKAYEGVEVEHKELGEGAAYVLCGTMKKNANNSYQGMKLRNATVVLKATQISGDTYSDVVVDGSGEIDFSQAIQVKNFEEFKTAVGAATEEKPALIVLGENIDVSSTVTVNGPVQIYSFSDNTITLGATKTLFDISETGSLYIEGVTLTASTNTASVFIKTNSTLELRDCEVVNVNTKNAEGTKYSIIEGRKNANIILTNSKFIGNDCLYMIRDYNNTDNASNDREGKTYTKIQYCTFNENKASWMFWIRSNYSILGGNISDNTSSNAIFRLVNVKAAELSLQYVTLKNNTTTGNQAAIAWVQTYATMNVNVGTIIEGNTASRSYGNIKAGAKSTLNIDGATIKEITLNNAGNETDNFTGIVNDNANVSISASTILEGIHDRLAGYVIGTEWSAKAE